MNRRIAQWLPKFGRRTGQSVVVFLHIPKTAGQTVHNELVKLVGCRHVSPVRVHHQGADGGQMPAGYRLYSGHIDWVELDKLSAPKFVFSVLRDPRARIASYYFYLEKEALRLSPQELSQPENTGKRMILRESADDYFFGGDAQWKAFIADHYDNFYTSYFATRRMRGHGALLGLSEQEQIDQALEGIACLDRLYHTDNLSALEVDLAQRFGKRCNLVGNYLNAGTGRRGENRWERLLDRFKSAANIEKLEAFVQTDEKLLTQVRFV